MASMSLYVLMGISLIQFILILKLVSIHNDNQIQLSAMTSGKNNNPNDNLAASTSSSTSSSSLSLTENSLESHQATKVFLESDNTKSLEGVAVTIFLDLPRWYARRYSMMVQNAANNIPDNWKIQIFYTGKGGSQMGLDINPGIQHFIDNGDVILTLLPTEMHRMRRMHIMFQPWFWENMLADKVFIFGGGSVICSNSPLSIKNFIQYDYLGAPWGNKRGIGGDGGTAIGAISIRNRQVMLQAIHYAMDKVEDPKAKLVAYKEWDNEDIFFINTLLEMQQKNIIHPNIAPKEVTYQFAAIGSWSNESVLVATGTLPEVEFGVRDKFLQYCPEMKVMYPSLHDPNCFGASPNGEECAKSICALKPKEERPSGC